MTQPRPRSVLFDHDGGVDDLISLTMLLAMPHIDLVGVVVPRGVCFLQPAVSATLKILRLFNRSEIPVSAGTLYGINPFPRSWRVHPYTIDALPILNESQAPLATPLAVAGHDFLAHTLHETASPLTVLITGPCSNLAKTLSDEPDLVSQIEEVIWMGGALDVPGNVRDYEHDGSAEWNVYWDPIAGQRLWQTEAPMTLFPLDATNQVPVTMELLHRLARQRRYPLSDFVGQCYATTVGSIPQAEYLYYMWDTLSTGYLGAPSLMQFRQLYTEVVPDGNSAGRIRAVTQGGKAIRAADAVDVAAFQEYFLELLKSPVHQAKDR